MAVQYNFLFISYDALAADLAWTLKKEGHKVRMYVSNEGSSDIGDGFFEKIEDYTSHIEWADVIIFDDVLGHGKMAEHLRRSGKLVIGGTEYTDRLEDDRSFGQEELKKHGIHIIPYREFSDFDAAIAYIKEKPAAYVIKPSGEAQNVKRLLFVGEQDDGKDVIQVLEAYKRVWSDKIKIFQLQKRVKGVEVAVGAFFNGLNFITPININFEHKKLFPGNIGPSTGEMGTAMYWSDENKLFTTTLKKLEVRLRQEAFVGYIDLNCIVNAQGIYPLEFTARFGYPTIAIQTEGMLTPVGEFFYLLASGKDPKLKTKKGFQVGVRILVPPYPFDDEKSFNANSRDSLIIFQNKKTDGVHLEDVKRINEEWLVAGNSGVVLVVCGSGTTMKQAQAQAYSRVKNILIPHMYYRTDIGDRWSEDSDRLHAWGYLREA